MKSVFTQEWVDDEFGHSGYNRRYSIHRNEKDRSEFARAHGKKVSHGGRVLRPNGRWAVIGVDDDTYEQMRNADHGMWFAGTAYWDGREFQMGGRSN